MNANSYTDGFFCNLSPTLIVELIEKANGPICYAAPGVQLAPAQALVKAADRLGPERLTVWIDFDERVMRMGYGDIEAVTKLRDAGITVHHAPGLRSALIIADGEGYTYTPTPLYLEAEPNSTVRNALRLSTEQVSDALARLSPSVNTAPKLPPQSQPTHMFQPPFEHSPAPVTDTQFAEVSQSLQDAPPIKFDLARQVRVYEPYLQYVELKLTGAAIQRHRLAIPPSIQKLGGNEALEGRLRTTFDLIEKDGNLSSKVLEDQLNEIRKNFTPSLGKVHGRVVLKAAKPHLSKRLEEFRAKLEAHQAEVKANLQKHLDDSKNQIIDYYLHRVIENPPDSLLGQSLQPQPTQESARTWLKAELDRVFPTVESLIQKMTLDEHYKDVTIETLQREDFLGAVKTAFPHINWDKAHNEFIAASQGQAPTRHNQDPNP